MTEEEAKTKWCPMVRTSSGGLIGNRDNAHDGQLTSFDDGSRCIGSACMMWRSGATVKGDPSGSYGYCGLAGN